jgi:hypothetical protein
MSTFVLITGSTITMALNHAVLTQHFVGMAQAFWNAEAGAAEGVSWLLRANPLPGGTVILGQGSNPPFLAPGPANAANEVQVTSQAGTVQGTFRVTVTRGVGFVYTIASRGTSAAEGIQRTVSRTVRITAPIVWEREFDLTIGTPNTIPAQGTTPDYTYWGWKFGQGVSPTLYWWNGEFVGAFAAISRALFIRLNDPIAGGDFSVDLWAAYTPCRPGEGNGDQSQCGTPAGNPGHHTERMSVYISGIQYDIMDPERGQQEGMMWYKNMGSCAGTIDCGEGNLAVPGAQAVPIYLDQRNNTTTLNAALGDNLDGVAGADDIRGNIVIVPWDAWNPLAWNNPFNFTAGSESINNVRVRKVDKTGRTVELLGWNAE